MGASITLAGESLITQKYAAQEGLSIVRFIFANVSGLDPSSPVDRAAGKPSAASIVYTYQLPEGNAGYVNPNQVVYSAQIGSDIGDWDFNWIGLETAEGVLFAVSYVPLQQKRRNIPPLQIGNNLTRNFLLAFDGAQALTGLTIDATTWQHDFTVRLAGIDERERMSNRDIFGRACFFGSSLQVEKVGSSYQLKPGTAYVEGVRLQRVDAFQIAAPQLPATAWLDVALQRELSDVVASWSVVFGANRTDYVDSAGVQHYCVPLADITTATVTDRRSVEAINGPLVTQYALRTGDYLNLRARATTKQDVGLGNLPNAKSDDVDLSDSESLATSKAVAKLWKSICVNTSSTAVNKTLSAAERGLVQIDASGGDRVITLPVSNSDLGVIDFVVRRSDNTSNRLVIQANGTDRIRFHTHLRAEGYPFLVLMGAGDWWHLRSDGAGGWIPVGRLDSTHLGRPVMETTALFPPGGYGAVNGGLFNRADWPWLWDHAQQSGMLTTEAARTGREGGWTSGDGSLTFRGPELRGEFARFADDGRGKDPSRVVGSSQLGQNESHRHYKQNVDVTGVLYSLSSGLTGGSTVGGMYVHTAGGAGLDGGYAGINTGLSGGTESRPRNVAYLGRIKLI